MSMTLLFLLLNLMPQDSVKTGFYKINPDSIDAISASFNSASVPGMMSEISKSDSHDFSFNNIYYSKKMLSYEETLNEYDNTETLSLSDFDSI